MSYTIAKPDCTCGHGHFFHSPGCLKCKCSHYVNSEQVTITDVIEKENAATKSGVAQEIPKKLIPRKPSKNETQTLICPCCQIIETVSNYNAPPLFHRHEHRLFKLNPFLVPVIPENSQ